MAHILDGLITYYPYVVPTAQTTILKNNKRLALIKRQAVYFYKEIHFCQMTILIQ